MSSASSSHLFSSPTLYPSFTASSNFSTPLHPNLHNTPYNNTNTASSVQSPNNNEAISLQELTSSRIIGGSKNKKFVEAAVPLIIVEHGRFSVSEEAKHILSKLKGPIAIVSIAGLYRTGKSFILNQLLGRMSGFEIGPSVKPCTKGLWMWGTPMTVRNRHHDQMTLLFIDTEGIGSFNANETHDAQIFALALLLSSFFVYNSLGNIDDNAIQRLAIVTELTRYIRAKKTPNYTDDEGVLMASKSMDLSFVNEHQSNKEIRDLSAHFPNFLWLVRDFTLELTDENGKAISSKEYLEMVLRSTDENSLQGTKKKQIKDSIKEYFVERDCYTIVRPVVNEKKLQQIANISVSEVRDEFKRQAEELKELIFTSVKPKEVHGTLLNGRMFLSLCKSYCQALNEGGIVVDSCWDNVVRTECESAFMEAKKFYVQQMQKIIREQGIIELQQAETFHAEKEEEAFKLFSELAVGDERITFERELKKAIYEKFLQIKEILKQTSSTLSVQSLTEIQLDIEKKINGGEYLQFVNFEQDFTNLIHSYNNKAKGSEKSTVLLNFLLRWLTPSLKQVHHQILDRTVGAMTDEYKVKEKRLTDTIDELSLKFDEEKSLMTQKVTETEKSKEKFKEQCNEYSKALAKLEDRLSTKERELAENIKKLKEFEDEKRQLVLKLQKSQTETSDHLSQLKDFKNDIKDLQQKNEKLVDNYSKMEQKYNATKLEVDSVKLENSSHIKTISYLEQKRDEYSSKIAEFQQEIELLQDKYSTAVTNIQKIEENLIQTERVLKETQSEKSIVSDKLSETEQFCTTLKTEIATYEAKLRKVERELSNKDFQMKSVERALEREKEKVADNEDRLKKSVQEREKLLSNDKTKSLEHQIEELNAMNRRILEINKKVMEENRSLHEIAGISSPIKNTTLTNSFSKTSASAEQFIKNEPSNIVQEVTDNEISNVRAKSVGNSTSSFSSSPSLTAKPMIRQSPKNRYRETDYV